MTLVSRALPLECDGDGWAGTAMSWFLVVQTINNTCYKLIVWGTGEQHASLLFDLDNDSTESNNLIGSKQGLQTHQQLFNQLDSSLRSVVDYPTVALSVRHTLMAHRLRCICVIPEERNCVLGGKVWASFVGSLDQDHARLEE